MKKSAVLALKIIPQENIPIFNKLERLNIYYIYKRSFFSQMQNLPKTPVMLTHFYTRGVRFKILTNTNNLIASFRNIYSRNGYYSISYAKLGNFIIEPMPAEDLPLFAGQAHPHMADAFKRAKPFKNLKKID